MSQNTLQKTVFLMVKSWWFVMTVIVFVVETINIFCDDFILFFIFFSRNISLYQLYSGIQWYKPSLVPPQK